MNILINYANWRNYFSRRYNSLTGKEVAGIDRVIEYSLADVEKNFRRRNKRLFRRAHGAGYWVWKPWIILKTLEEMQEDDFLFYSDAGIVFINSVQPLIQRMKETGQDIMPFWVRPEGKGEPEKHWTKRDAFVLMDCDSPEYTDTPQVLGGFHLWKKTRFSVDFAAEWLRYIQDERIVGDAPNRCGLQNYPDFYEHRHDQSVFSLLIKKHRLLCHRPPQYPPQTSVESVERGHFSDDRYPRIISVQWDKASRSELVLQLALSLPYVSDDGYVRKLFRLVRSLCRAAKERLGNRRKNVWFS